MIAEEECDTRWHEDDHCLKKGTAIDGENDRERVSRAAEMRLKCQMSHTRTSETASRDMFPLA